jgi:AAA family ATP:ADP antiporter
MPQPHQPQPTHRESAPPAGVWRTVLSLQPGEARLLAWAGGLFFCVLCSYSMLRPVREAMGIARGVDELSWLFLATLGATLICNPLLGSLINRFSPRVFIPIAYRILAVSLVAMFVLFSAGFEGEARAMLSRVFFVWLTVYILFATSLFWAVMVDVFSLEQSKRLFGLLGVGGTLGAITGAWATSQLAEQVSPAYLMLGAAGVLEAGVLCFRMLMRCADRTGTAPSRQQAVPTPPAGKHQPDPELRGGALAGIVHVFQSPYLAGVCLYIAAIAVSSTFFYFAQARIVDAAAPDDATRSAMFARIDFWSQCATLTIQVFATGHLLRKLGVGLTLTLLPLISIGGLAALAFAPALGTLIMVQVAHRAGRFALARPARETLFTVVSREDKYKAKSFVDTFMFRAGDVAGALADRGLASAGLAVASMTGLLVPFAAGWGLLGVYLGAAQRRQAATHRAGVSETSASREVPVAVSGDLNGVAARAD